MEILDKDKKGFLDFRTFSTAFGPNMAGTLTQKDLKPYTNLRTNTLMDKKQQCIQSKSMI